MQTTRQSHLGRVGRRRTRRYLRLEGSKELARRELEKLCPSICKVRLVPTLGVGESILRGWGLRADCSGLRSEQQVGVG